MSRMQGAQRGYKRSREDDDEEQGPQMKSMRQGSQNSQGSQGSRKGQVNNSEGINQFTKGRQGSQGGRGGQSRSQSQGSRGSSKGGQGGNRKSGGGRGSNSSQQPRDEQGRFLPSDDEGEEEQGQSQGRRGGSRGGSKGSKGGRQQQGGLRGKGARYEQILEELHEDNEFFEGEDEYDEDASIAEDVGKNTRRRSTIEENVQHDPREAARKGLKQLVRTLREDSVEGEPDDTSNMSFTARSSGKPLNRGKQGSQNKQGGQRGGQGSSSGGSKSSKGSKAGRQQQGGLRGEGARYEKELEDLHEANEMFGGEDEYDMNSTIAEDVEKNTRRKSSIEENVQHDPRESARRGLKQTIRVLRKESVQGEPDDTSNMSFTARSSGKPLNRGKQGSQNKKGGN